MSSPGVDPLILEAWLSARSIARGLPSPVAEFGGFRVDTRSDVEVARWVFPGIESGFKRLVGSVCKPRYFIKLCGSADDLRAALPVGWSLHAPGYFMQATGAPPARRLADGFRIEAKQVGKVREARIFTTAGVLAASGFAVETRGALIYDRIATAPKYRRMGLGQALMQTLHDARRDAGGPELLVATPDGLALYASLGWQVISPYSTASIVAP